MTKLLDEIENECREAYERHIPNINISSTDFKKIEKALSLISIDKSEQVLGCFNYLDGHKIGAFIVTDKRCILLKPKLFGGEVVNLSYDKIVSLHSKNTLLYAKVIINTGEKEYDFTHLKCNELVQFINFAMDNYKKPKEKQIAENNIIEELEKLFELKSKGALNEHEFQMLKEKLIKNKD